MTAAAITIHKASGTGFSIVDPPLDMARVFEVDEQAAWAPPERLPPSRWAEKHRYLPRSQSNLDGPWENANAPYLAGIMDLAAAPGVEQLNIRKAAQVGVSEALRTLMAYWAATDPDPAGLCLPDQRKGQQIVQDRILPLFRETPVLTTLLTDKSHDLKSSHIVLRNGFLLFLMWSGSAAAMAADPMRRVICDETDKFRPWVGKEADPVALTWKRLGTYEGRSIQINVSTPTTPEGTISRLVEDSTVVLFFLVPCPHCGHLQRLVFANLKWKKFNDRQGKPLEGKALADRVVRERAVWYECAKCRKAIGPEHRDAMVAAGRWATEDGSIPDAAAVERWPEGTRIAIDGLNRLYCRWSSWWSVAGEFLRAGKQLSKLWDFTTQTLGAAFAQQIESVPADLFARLSQMVVLEEGIVPEWTGMVLATIDTQHDSFFVVVRAWGPEMTSARVWHGQAHSFEELEMIVRRPWPVEGAPAEGETWPPVAANLVLIDSGGTMLEGERASRTMEVYRWVSTAGPIVRAIKGATWARRQAGQFFWPGKPPTGDAQTGKARRPPIWFVDSQHFQDELAQAIRAGSNEGERRRWFLNKRDDPEYAHHLAAVHKVMVRRGAAAAYEWRVKSEGMADHYRDCEVYQFAAAYMAGVHILPDRETLRTMRLDLMRRGRAREAAAQKSTQGEGGQSPWTPTQFNP